MSDAKNAWRGRGMFKEREREREKEKCNEKMPVFVCIQWNILNER